MTASIDSRRRFLAAGGGALGTIAIAGAPARAAQFHFKVGAGLPVEHPSNVRGKEMWEQIVRESGGRIEAQYFPNNQLGGNLALQQQLRVGAIPFLLMAAGDLNAIVPATDITNLGFAFKNIDECFRVVDGPLGDYLYKEILSKGLQPFRTVWDSGIRQIISSSHPIRTPEDMTGFKIRVVESRIVVDFFKTLGANPTPLSAAEVYTAMQTKVVDGADFPLISIETFRFFEVQKYLSLTSHNWSCLWWLANPDAWKAVPADLQALIERNVRKFGLLERRDSKLLNAATGDKLVRQGLKANTPDTMPFRARLGPYYTRWRNEFGPTEWGLLQSSVSEKLP